MKVTQNWSQLIPVLLLFLLQTLAAQPASKPALPTNASTLVETVVQNELNQRKNLPFFAWKEQVKKPSRVVVKQYVNTPQGILGSYVSINGHPLTAEERSADDLRLQRLTDPKLMASKRKEQRQDEERVIKIVRALPNAFFYQYSKLETYANGHTIVHLTFVPNPSFNPPNRESYVFQGMSGELTIDQTINRMVKLEGTLSRDVTIGWGVIGRLNRGGSILIEQGDVGYGHWDQTNLKLDFYGKALFFMSIRINEYDTQYDFQPVQPMNVPQALEYMRHLREQH